MVLNPYNLMILIDNAIIMTLIGGSLLLLAAFHVLTPMKTLIIQSDNFTIKSSFLKSDERIVKGLRPNIKKFKEAFKQNFKDPVLKKKFINRISFMIIASGIGIIILIWEYFFYFNLFNIFNI